MNKSFKKPNKLKLEKSTIAKLNATALQNIRGGFQNGYMDLETMASPQSTRPICDVLETLTCPANTL